MKNERLKYSLLFGLLGALLFTCFLGGVHLFDWDEINFAEVSREMIVLGDYLHVNIDFKPFWEKPPLFFWLQVVSMKLFGVGEFAARFPNAICGVIVLVLLFNLGTKLKSIRFGILWALAYFGSILPHLYFKSGIIDPWFNLFIFLSIYFLIQFHWKKNGFEAATIKKSNLLQLVWAGIFLGLAVLTKGPVALLITCIVLFVYWIYQRFRFFINPFQAVLFLLAAILVPSIWFGIETAVNGPWLVQEFIKYQYRLFSTPDAGHGGFPGFHPIVLLLGCFPASIFALRSLFKWQSTGDKKQADFRVWMLILFWVVLILFIMVQSKIVHYSSLCYYPLTYLAALTIDGIIKKEVKFSVWMKALFVFVAALYIIVFISAPILASNLEWIKPLINDEFTLANLEADVNWTGFEVLPGILLLLIVLAFLVGVKRNASLKHFAFLFSSIAVFVLLSLVFYIKRVEGYSQRAAIEFLEERQGEDCLVVSHGYKTYADLFYTKKQVPKDTIHPFLYLGKYDNEVPVYVITKVHKSRQLEEWFSDLEKLGSKNGFVFYKREVSSSAGKK